MNQDSRPENCSLGLTSSTKNELLESFFDNLELYVQSRLNHHTAGDKSFGMNKFHVIDSIEKDVKRTRSNMSKALSELLDRGMK